MIYPRIIAHRCGGALAPENTLAGLRLAARLGCRGVEFDATLTADGVPVLMHDLTLQRTTSGRGRVARLDSAQFARLDAGARHHRAFTAEPAPTLAAALELCAVLGLWANVELKPSVGWEAETGRIVARQVAALPGQWLLSSFAPEALAAAAIEAHAVPRALLVERIPADWRERMAAAGALATHASARTVTAAGIRTVRDAGFPLACYTVNRRDDAEHLFALGVSAVFTDRPDLWAAAEM